ncbi:HAD-like domain-containing protein [Mycena floridula]|nr:HAD-like domain-containing protein [Mycena floridula]
MAISQILFDCDNTLVLSEEIAFEACAELANEVLELKGNSARYTGSQLMTEFVGQNFRGMMTSLQAKYGFEMEQADFDDLVRKEEDKVISMLEQRAQPCAGANEALESLAASKQYGLAVVSSSALRRVRASLKKANQERFFPKDHVFSAATSLPTPTSKPDPAIYLHACKVLGKEPGECIAVEDSRSGALSAVRAGIHVVGYVGSCDSEEEKERMTKVLKETGAEVIMKDWSEFQHCLASIRN